MVSGVFFYYQLSAISGQSVSSVRVSVLGQSLTNDLLTILSS